MVAVILRRLSSALLTKISPALIYGTLIDITDVELTKLIKIAPILII